LAITTASAGTARAINVEIQRRRNYHRTGASVVLADGTRAFVGDQVVTRRNDVSLTTDTGSPVRNRQTRTVTEVGEDGTLTLSDPKRGRNQLPAGTWAATSSWAGPSPATVTRASPPTTASVW
jgi:hypothetical protein